MKSTTRVPSGITGLDQHIGGGFPAERATLVCGAVGTGKTTFGVQFLVESAARGDAGLFVTLDEKPQHIFADMRRFGWELEGPGKGATVTVLDASPYFTAKRGPRPPTAYQVAHDLIGQAQQRGVCRLVIDSVSSFVPFGTPSDQRADFMRRLVTALEGNLACTTLLTAEDCDAVAPFTAGTIQLSVEAIDGRPSRSLVVRSMQGISPSFQRPFDIVDGQGLLLR
jgi:KaiC/GvpD/RAD55 family RecA-like ATPase